MAKLSHCSLTDTIHLCRTHSTNKVHDWSYAKDAWSHVAVLWLICMHGDNSLLDSKLNLSSQSINTLVVIFCSIGKIFLHVQYSFRSGNCAINCTISFKVLTFEKSLLFSAHLMQQGYCDTIHTVDLTVQGMQYIQKSWDTLHNDDNKQIKKKTDDTFWLQGGGGGGEIKIKFWNQQMTKIMTSQKIRTTTLKHCTEAVVMPIIIIIIILIQSCCVKMIQALKKWDWFSMKCIIIMTLCDVLSRFYQQWVL